ncbi:hypothetical protein A6V36_20470 [Paraburkholderia ginsengiterrae]|uniref:Uncharacterized protein n=1 Tax=Paraburkholderia ginsengiterrae TaxID=1462993 RepID=A0A1A9ND83_9BURK|nr:hypothetical protein A6V36_20470 [Paraburkholderia ginsengiterrae]OAJ64477.1 hypothetical protein A6V37_19495 [Paraburkholderia ginsengiterrae]
MSTEGSGFERRNQIADAHNFEAFALELLSFHVKNQNKPFELGRTGRSDFDAFASDGFDEFNCPVIVECMLAISRQRYRAAIERALRFIDERRSKGELLGRLVVLFVVEQQELKETVLGIHAEQAKNREVETKIWTWSQLEHLAQLYPERSNEILDNLLPLRVRNVVNNLDADWRSGRQSRVSELWDRFHTGQFSLFLGAGVSSSAGMPDWNTLLNALFVTYLANGASSVDEQETLRLVKRMNIVDGHSALVAARYLRKGIGGNSADSGAFKVAIREALYRLRRQDQPMDSDLIKTLVKLCMPRRSGALVRSVVTYNFDDLFERQLDTKTIPFRCVFSENAVVDADELPVYHVHGFIPERADLYHGVEDATLVFAEEGYHHIYTDAYHWSNLVQLNALRDSTCLMVGLSMTDPNLRRLLEIAKRGVTERRHYAFMKRTDIRGFAFDRDSDGEETQVLPDLDAAGKFLNERHALTEVLMDELGVTIIWYQDYNEIPTILRQMGFPNQPGL